MRVLVCVKRVPAPGARINLTEDQLSVDTRHLAFTVSPHEECAVEEAIRLKEGHGGTVTIMTLGPAEAEEQLRYALSVGGDSAELLTTDGGDWDPQATSMALEQRIRELEGAEGIFDLVMFGNESADSGGYQVGIRVAHRLGRPVIGGAKRLAIEEGSVVIHRDSGDGFDVHRLPLPAVVTVKEGINLPRYPTLPGRLHARKAEIAVTAAQAEPGGLRLGRLVAPPEQASSTVVLGTGPEAASAVVDIFEELGLL